MPTGERRRAAGRRGFTYLVLLFVLAGFAAGLAALGTHWPTAMQREREIELEFRGRAIVQALESWARAAPPGTPVWPQRLEELLEDRRGAQMRRHLRRIPDDPFTQAPDWVLLTDETKRIHGVHSRAELAALRAPAPASGASAVLLRVSDKHFIAREPAAAASAASAAGPASAPATAASAAASRPPS